MIRIINNDKVLERTQRYLRVEVYKERYECSRYIKFFYEKRVKKIEIRKGKCKENGI